METADTLLRQRPVQTPVSTALRILSLGAGVQSSSLALMCAHGMFEMPDAAIFADTGAEPQSVYKWLNWLEKQLPFPVYRVTRGNLGEAAVELKTSKNDKVYTKHAIPAFIIDDSGAIGLLKRQCTESYKIEVIQRKIRQLMKENEKQKVIQYIGISFDELHRMKDSRNLKIKNVYPLVDKGLRRIDCIRWMQENNYPTPPRSACVFCPYHSDKEWLRLKTEESEEFRIAVEFEKKLQTAMSKVYNFRGTPYLHRSCQPIETVDFDPHRDQIEFDFFGNECEGMCGV